MVEIDSNSWLRTIEILSLLINIISWPAGFFSISILSWYFLIPLSNYPNLIYFGILIFLILGFIWDTRYGPVGIFLVQPFKNYLKHSETKDDKFYALASLAGTFCIIAFLYGIVQIILSL